MKFGRIMIEKRVTDSVGQNGNDIPWEVGVGLKPVGYSLPVEASVREETIESRVLILSGLGWSREFQFKHLQTWRRRPQFLYLIPSNS